MNERKKTRSVSEETQLRELLVHLTDLVLEVKENARKNNLVLLARLKEIDNELESLGKLGKGQERRLEAVAMLTGDTNTRVIDLHAKAIGQADKLGQRVYELEKERGKSRRTSRPTGRG